MRNVNDVYAYQFNKDGSKKKGVFGKYMLLQKIGSGKVYPGDEPRMRVKILDKIFDELPTLNEIDGVHILPVDFPTRVNISKDAQIYEDINITTKKDPIWMSALMEKIRSGAENRQERQLCTGFGNGGIKGSERADPEGVLNRNPDGNL